MSLLHGFQQSGLSLRGRSIDFVGQKDVGKQRPLNKLKRFATAFRIILQNVGTGDVGRHQVRSKLNSPESKLQNRGDGAAQQGLGQTRNATQQTMASAKHGDQQLIHHFVLPDNDLTEFAPALQVIEVPGDHDSMVLEPNVRVLAGALRRAIAEAEPAECPTLATAAE